MQGKSKFKAKMANNVLVKCVGICRKVKIIVCAIKVAVHMYVISTKRESYPIIFGRPWLLSMNATKHWEKGTLILKPPRQKLGEVIVCNMNEGKQDCLEEETSKKSESSTELSSFASESTSQSSNEGAVLLKYVGSLSENLVKRVVRVLRRN